MHFRRTTHGSFVQESLEDYEATSHIGKCWWGPGLELRVRADLSNIFITLNRNQNLQQWPKGKENIWKQRPWNCGEWLLHPPPWLAPVYCTFSIWRRASFAKTSYPRFLLFTQSLIHSLHEQHLLLVRHHTRHGHWGSTANQTDVVPDLPSLSVWWGHRYKTIKHN